jgi:hypothetical protein
VKNSFTYKDVSLEQLKSLTQTNDSNWIRHIHKLVAELVFLCHKLAKRPNAIAFSGMVTRSNVSHA